MFLNSTQHPIYGECLNHSLVQFHEYLTYFQTWDQRSGNNIKNGL